MDAKVGNYGTLSGSISRKSTLFGTLSIPNSIVVEGGTMDYEKLSSKPKIEGVELIGDKSFEDLGMRDMTDEELQTLITNVFG